MIAGWLTLAAFATEPGCPGAEVVELALDGYRVSATGLGIRIEGTSHDDFADGSFDDVLDLHLWSDQGSERWMPSALAGPTAPKVILDHCVQLLDGSGPGIRLAVAPVGPPASPVEPCGPPDAPALADYSDAIDGTRFHLDVARDPSTGEWRPAEALRMPLHHASRLSWRGLTGFPAPSTATGPVRFVAQVRSHTIERVGDSEWRAEYVAEVRSVCRPRRG